MSKTAVIVGGGFGGLATACLLAKGGYRVTVLEKNEQLGGRAGQLKATGFTFDTGPSWYLMPDVFEHFFALMNEDISDHIELVRLSPSYRVRYAGYGEVIDIQGVPQTDAMTFERIEPGAGQQLLRYLDTAAYMHRLSMDTLLYRNYDSLKDLAHTQLLSAGRDAHPLKSMHGLVSKHFTDVRLRQILLYPSIFLGTSPYKTPAVYSLLNHVDLQQGVFYPMGGMYGLVEALVAIGKRHGVTYRTNAPVERIIIKNNTAAGVVTQGKTLEADVVISNADLHHTETQLLDKPHRDHSARYWQTRTMAPSALVMHLGVDRQYDSLLHHNLLFEQDWRREFRGLFGTPIQFPAASSLYVCAPGKTDASVAPEGHENLCVLAMLPAGLRYTDEQLEAYADMVLATMERDMQLPGLRDHIVYKKYFCADDFASRFNSYKGTGLGLSHTLRQTALFRPGNQSKKVKGLYYVGANVHPGIGLPAILIGAELLCRRLLPAE
jgi:phytoene desaturase